MVEVFDSTISSSDAYEEREFVGRCEEVLNNNDTQKSDGINAVLHDEVGTGVEKVDKQPGSVQCYLL